MAHEIKRRMGAQSLLMRLFGSALPQQPEVPEDPIAAVNSSPPEVVVTIALGHGEEALRAAAIGRLPDGAVLRQLADLSAGASGNASASLERIAQQRMAHLIDAGAVDFDGLCAAAPKTSALLAVAGLCSDPAPLSKALASIDDPRKMAKLVVEGPSSRVRQAAARTIENPTELKRLLVEMRGKDKSAYRIIKEKCDALRAEEERLAQIESDVAAVCASLEQHSHRAHDAFYATSLDRLEERWRALDAQAAAAIRERVREAIGRCHLVIAENARELTRQAIEASEQAERDVAREQVLALQKLEAQRRDEAAALTAAVDAARQEAEEKARAERLAAEAHALRQLGGLIAKANGSLREGNTGRASGLRRAIEEKLATGPAVPPHLARQLVRLDEQMNELKGWKEHAAAPKRAELIAEMQSLIASSEAPRALADRIQQLQEDWRTVSKGIVSDSGADWERFHQASESAYLPCRAYFEAQAKLRQANLAKRKEVLERLCAFESAQSGEHPDWRALTTVLREAPLEWQRAFPVDRAAGRAVDDEFNACMHRLQGRLDARYTQNAADKRSVIQRARQLLTKEDSRDAVEAVKRLQLQWKETGPVQRKLEQDLWLEFREQCDAVFQKRRQAETEYAAGLETNKAKAAALCEEAEQAGGLSGPALLEGGARIPEWRVAFETLGEMPRGEQRAIRDRFERALELIQKAVIRQRVLAKEQGFIDLFEAARRINAYGWAVAHAAASSDLETLKEAAETFISGVPHWPKGGAQALKDAWAKAECAAGLDAPVAEIALRTLCIRAEILAERATPPEDQILRREYQVRRLVERMGQGSETATDELDALALEWARIGPTPVQTHEDLLRRHLHCRHQSMR
jgi:hypothetical protein